MLLWREKKSLAWAFYIRKPSTCSRPIRHTRWLLCMGGMLGRVYYERCLRSQRFGRVERELAELIFCLSKPTSGVLQQSTQASSLGFRWISKSVFRMYLIGPLMVEVKRNCYRYEHFSLFQQLSCFSKRDFFQEKCLISEEEAGD